MKVYYPNPCKICKSQNLRAMQNSSTNELWVSCDHCGQTGEAGSNPETAVKNWNKTNPKRKKI